MAKKTLEEKIKHVLIIFSIGTPAYIVLSLLLLNDYSSDATFDPKKVYDVVKDGLILAATFLAPVAAFVLFSDWREQFKAGIKDEITSQLYELNFKIRQELHILRFDLSGKKIDELEYKNRNEVLFNNIKIFENGIKRLVRVGLVSTYTNNAEEVKIIFSSLKDTIASLHHHQTERYKLSEDEIKELINKEQITWHWNEINKNLEKFDQKFSKLEMLVSNMDSWSFDDSIFY